MYSRYLLKTSHFGCISDILFPFSRRTHRVRTAKMSLYIKNPSRNSSFRRFREHIEKEMRINMSVTFAGTMRGYEKKNIIKDVIAGIIIMAVSIPISMGYAQIAGLPAVCGLYGSVFPIIAFALLSTSPQFVFGVDARVRQVALAGYSVRVRCRDPVLHPLASSFRHSDVDSRSGGVAFRAPDPLGH